MNVSGSSVTSHCNIIYLGTMDEMGGVKVRGPVNLAIIDSSHFRKWHGVQDRDHCLRTMTQVWDWIQYLVMDGMWLSPSGPQCPLQYKARGYQDIPTVPSISLRPVASLPPNNLPNCLWTRIFLGVPTVLPSSRHLGLCIRAKVLVPLQSLGCWVHNQVLAQSLGQWNKIISEHIKNLARKAHTRFCLRASL